MHEWTRLAAPLLLAIAVCAGAQEERIIFRDPCDDKPTLRFWTGDRPTEFTVETVSEDPEPAEGTGCWRATMTWGEPAAGYSYFTIASFSELELRHGVNYRFRGRIYCPDGNVTAKVRWVVGGREVIWHPQPIPQADGWTEFALENLRGMALAIAPADLDRDRVFLRSIFFNLTGSPEVFAVDDIRVTAEGTPLPQYVRPQASSFALEADFPLLRVEIEGPCEDLVLKREGAEAPVFTAEPYPEAKEAGVHVFRARLDDGFPSALEASGGGRIISLTGRAHDPADPGGGPSVTYHSADGARWERPEGEIAMPERPLPPISVGIYYAPYTINDPSMLPSRAWLVHPKPAQVAVYDFSVLQTSEGYPSREFCDEIMRLNPDHKIILRLPCIMGAIPKYAHEPFYREGFMQYYDSVIERAGPENIYAVTIGEEENGNFMRGLWWTDTPPDWVAMYRQPFERETGAELTWINAVCGNRDYLEWLKPKIRFFYNDVYDRLNERRPDLPVLQYLALADDGSEIAWHEPGEIKADGWVYWSFRMIEVPVLVTCRVQGEDEPVRVWMWRDLKFKGMQRLRESGIDNDMIYHCGFAHYPEERGFYDVIEQMKLLQDLGYRHSFMYYPLGGKLEPEDCRDPALVHEMDEGNFKMWRERRQRVLEYMREM